MNAKRNAITKMLESFPPTGGNYVVLIASFEEQLSPHSDEAVERAVRRYSSGDVPNQNMKFAPSVAEFVQEVRKCQEYLDALARPRLAPPQYRRGPLAPFEMRAAKAREAHAHLPILHEDVTYDQWRRLSASREVPEGAVWVACLGTVYGPAKNASARAA